MHFFPSEGKKVGIPDKENPGKLSRTPKRVPRPRVPITNYPEYGSDDSDTSTLAWDGTDDEVISALGSLHGSYILHSRKENVEMLGHLGESTRNCL